MIDFEPIGKLASPVAAIIAATIAAYASFRVRRHADRSDQISREMQLRIEQYRLETQTQIVQMNHSLALVYNQAQERFSLRAKALVEAARLAGETCYYVERFLTPYTVYEPASKEKLIESAEQSFEALIKFRWENYLFLGQNNRFSDALGDMMAGINAIRNMESENEAFSQQQAQKFLATVRPALAAIRDEFAVELKRVEP